MHALCIAPMPATKRTKHRVIITEFVGRQRKWIVASLTALLFALICFLKILSGSEIIFSAIFLLPIVFSTWFLSLWAGLAVTGLSTVVLLFVNLSEAHKYSRPFIPYWN